MRITAYPPYRAAIGADALDVDLPDGAPVRALLVWLAERYPGFRGLADAPSDEYLWQHLIVHVNDEIAGLRTPLKRDDRVDLLPTIAGGAPGGRRSRWTDRRACRPESGTPPIGMRLTLARSGGSVRARYERSPGAPGAAGGQDQG